MPFHNPAFHKYLTRLPLPVRCFVSCSLLGSVSALVSHRSRDLDGNLRYKTKQCQISSILCHYRKLLHTCNSFISRRIFFFQRPLVPGTNSEMEQTLPVSKVPILLLYRLLLPHTQICHRSFLPYRQAASTAPVLPSKNALSHGTDSRF